MYASTVQPMLMCSVTRHIVSDNIIHTRGMRHIHSDTIKPHFIDSGHSHLSISAAERETTEKFFVENPQKEKKIKNGSIKRA